MSGTLLLERFHLSEDGTIGKIRLPGGRVVFTLERPWIENRRLVSCIPDGTYRVEARRFNRGGYMAIGLCDVPQRSHILIHRANTVDEVQGCIAPGLSWDSHPDLRVNSSGAALDLLMQALADGDFTHLTIRCRRAELAPARSSEAP